MVRKVLGVIIGFVSMMVFTFITFSILYLILGPEGSFRPKSYEGSIIWIIISLIFSIVAAFLGGFICAVISQSRKSAMVLSVIVLLIGLSMAVYQLGPQMNEAEELRIGPVSNLEAMQKAKQPAFMLLMNPIIGALGIVGGARLKKEEED